MNKDIFASLLTYLTILFAITILLTSIIIIVGDAVDKMEIVPLKEGSR